MAQSTLSAAAAARYLGFRTANPIFDAIRSGELSAERGRAGRNGHATTNYRIQREDLDKLAEARGIKPVVAEITLAPEPNGHEPDAQGQEGPELPTEYTRTFPASNVTAIVPRAPEGANYLVTIPVEHYAALVAARAELEFIRANFELTWRGRK